MIRYDVRGIVILFLLTYTKCPLKSYINYVHFMNFTVYYTSIRSGQSLSTVDTSYRSRVQNSCSIKTISKRETKTQTEKEKERERERGKRERGRERKGERLCVWCMSLLSLNSKM